MNRHSPEFKKLQKKWYDVLKCTGFNDIEPGGELNKLHSTIFAYKYKLYGPEVFKAKEEYFRMARAFLSHHQFDSKKEELVWDLHTDGHSVRETTRICRAAGLKIGVSTVQKTVMMLRKQMMDEAREERKELEDNGN